MSTYNVSLCDCQTIKVIGKKSTDYLWKKTSKKERTEKVDKSKHNLEIMEDPVTYKASPISVEKSTAVKIRVFIVYDYHHEGLSVRIEQNE